MVYNSSSIRAKVIQSTKEDEVALEIVSVDGLQVDGGYINVQYDLGYIRGDEAEACRGKTDPWVTLENPGPHSGRAAQLGYRYAEALQIIFVSTTDNDDLHHTFLTSMIYYFI